MTRYVLDVASYQGDLTVADVVRAGFTAVNLKISHGLTQKAVHPDLTGWVARAQAAGLSIGTFHWLDASASGYDQASYAHARLVALGLLGGTAHTVDCEADATEDVLRGYVIEMQARLGRPVAVYSADWWWQQTGRRWNGRELTPYVWAAPNAGYLGAYPGDASSHWVCGWGGWTNLSAMQYAVAPLSFPDGSQGTIKVSKTAVRDEMVWAALTGGGVMASWILVPSLIALRNEFNVIAPNRDKATDGSVGDLAHQESVSDHNPDETGNTGSAGDSDSLNEVHAIDVDKTGPWPPGFSMEKAVQHLVAEHKAGRDKRLRYIIFNRRIWSASSGWVQRAYSGANAHTEHAHFSAAYGSGAGSSNPENDMSSYGLKTLIEEEDMPLDTTDLAKIKALIDAAVNPLKEQDGTKNPIWTAQENISVKPGQKPSLQRTGSVLRYTSSEHGDIEAVARETLAAVNRLAASVAVLATKDHVDEGALANALAGPLALAVVAAMPKPDPDDPDAEVPPFDQATLEEALRNVLRGAFASPDA